MFLEAKGVADVLTRMAPTGEAEKAKFEEMDRISKALLVSCLSDECLEIVREKTTTKEMWTSLESAYAKKSVASQKIVRKQLARLRMKEGADMRTHLLEFDGLVRKLKTAGATLAESDLVSQLFLTLPDSFDPLVTALENVAEEGLNLDLVKQRLLAEERKRSDRQGDSVEDKSAAFTSDSKKKFQKFQGKCTKCGRRGHMKKDCRQREANSAKKDAVCFMADANVAEKRPGRVMFKLDSGCSDRVQARRTFLPCCRR